MTFNRISDLDSMATVTVTFNPDINLLSAQLKALPEFSLKIIVDNASRPAIAEAIQDLLEDMPNTHLLSNSHNIGLAAAVNLGVRAVSELSPSTHFVLLLDQDSEPMANSVPALLEAFQNLGMNGNKVGCVGPALQDPDTELSHGFHQCTRWRWKRVYPTPDSMIPISCANLNGSGTLMPVALFLQLGGLDESLFIDHVDTEWAFRVVSAGYELWGVPNAVFIHRMGQASMRFWCFGWRIWPHRSPQRHYYLFRNACRLLRRRYVPGVWKFWAVIKVLLTILVCAFFDARRFDQLRQMFKGILDGLWKDR